MPPQTSGLVTNKPPSFLFKPLQIDGWGLFAVAAKVVEAGLTRKWSEVLDEALKAVQCIHFKADPRGLAWSLVYRAMCRAVAGVLRDPDVNHLTNEELQRAQAQAARFDAEPLADGVALDEDFFAHPGWSPYCQEMSRRLRGWLTAVGIEEVRADVAAWRLPLYFASQLSSEWLANKEHLDALKPEHFRTPFTPAVQEETAWADYASWLQHQANRRLFEEDFGFLAVYVPLRAYVETTLGPGKVRRTVQVAEELLDHWLEKGLPIDALRVVEGDPGAGKSSLARVYAATRLGRTLGGRRWRVVYVPLHHPALDVTKPLEEAVADYFLTIAAAIRKPLDKEAPDPTLLILDGLDELSRAGQVGEDIIRAFVAEVAGVAKSWNHGRDQAQLLVLLCGRPVAADLARPSVRNEEGVINLLPYLVPMHEFTRPRDGKAVEVAGQASLLDEDQRLAWWEKYARARGRDNGAELYAQLKGRADLAPLTAQPLLNYLIAFLAGPAGDLTALPSNLGDVYGQLLRRIWERGWEQREQVPALEGVWFEDFAEMLEAVALAAWHAGTTRSIRAALVEKKLTPTQRSLLGGLEQAGAGGVLRLLLAFFVRPLGREEGERTYEFTHKTFAEYLVARRLGRVIAELTADWEKARGSRLWSDEQALVRWAEVFGPVQFDTEVWAFLGQELQALSQEVVEGRQDLLTHLLGVVVRQGMPMITVNAQLGSTGTYWEMNRQALNCEHAFLEAIAACAARTGGRSRVEGLAEQIAGWINARWRVLRRPGMLRGLDFSGASLQGAGLGGADLSEANLVRAHLEGADLERANLSEANLGGADLSEAKLVHAILNRANLEGAKLVRAKLGVANLVRANLVGADLEEANLRGAYLVEAKLRGVKLAHAQLLRAYLVEADLIGANLKGAELNGANLRGADLAEADLEEAQLAGADLEEANLAGAVVSLEDLRHTVGNPSRMPDGKPPKKNWRTARPRTPRKKKTDSPPEAPVQEMPE
jgi:uncharacterized protein YjbI with pentapeptide repeats